MLKILTWKIDGFNSQVQKKDEQIKAMRRQHLPLRQDRRS